MKIESKNCKNCDETFYGRSNKLFCESTCKSEYHNRRYKAKLLLEIKEHIKKEIFEHLNNIAQITNLEAVKLRNGIYRKQERFSENKDVMFYIALNDGIRSEVKKIKSILLNKH